MEQLCTTSGEVNGQIIKDFLETRGIHATTGPNGFVMNNGSMGSNQAYLVFVERGKVDEATALLKEQGLLK